MFDIVPGIRQNPAQDIFKDIRPEIANMGIVVNSRAATIHADLTFFDGLEFLDGTAHCIVDGKWHGSLLIYDMRLLSATGKHITIVLMQMKISNEGGKSNPESKSDPFIRQNVLMSAHTSLGTGGFADWAAWPSTSEQLREAMEFAHSRNVPVTYVGGGTNILVSDKGIRGLVIFSDHLTSCHSRGRLFCTQSGLSLDNAINTSIEMGLTGLELLGGLPGTVGGAIAGNAGIKEMTISDVLLYIDYMTPDGALHRMQNTGETFAYHHSSFPGDEQCFIIEAGFILNPTRKMAEARLKKEEALRRRTEHGHYRYPSAGCTFRNPVEGSAGRIIDNLGLKGKTVGGAQVSFSHANFIINPEGKATSSDIFELSRLIHETVFKETGIDLQREVRLIGDWDICNTKA